MRMSSALFVAHDRTAFCGDMDEDFEGVKVRISIHLNDRANLSQNRATSDLKSLLLARQQALHDRPRVVGIEAVSFSANHQGTIVRCSRGLVQLFYDVEGLMNTVQWKNVVLLATDHHQLLGSDHDRQITHVKVAGDTGDVVAGAVVDIHNGIVVGADRAGWHEAVEAMLQAGGVVGCGAAARVAHENRALHGDEITEMSLNGVYHSHNVPYTLTDQGSSHKDGFHSGTDTGGALLGAAALPEGSLLDGQSREALGYGADTEVAVAARDGIFITGIFGNAKRDVRALGVTLESGAKGENSCLVPGEEKIAMSEVTLLGLKGEMNVAVAVQLILGDDLKDGITGCEVVQTQ